jgi:hypothetical protein
MRLLLVDIDSCLFYENRAAEAHHCGPLHLCAHSIGIHGQAAIDGHIDAWNRNMSVIRDGDLDHRRDIRNEAAVDGDAAAMTQWTSKCMSENPSPLNCVERP